MRFSPNGQHLLGGVGNNRIYLDNAIPQALAHLHAGGWDWPTPDTIMGPGGLDTPDVGFYSYNLSTGSLWQSVPGARATRFYAANERWLAYLSDGNTLTATWSFDSQGHQWKPYVAIGLRANGDAVLTDSSNQAWWLGHLDGTLAPIGKPPETGPATCQLPDGAQWAVDGSNGLEVYRLDTPTARYLLNATPHDFGPAIAYRTSDGLLVVGTGDDAGETSQHLYDVDVVQQRFRRDGGAWQALTTDRPVPAPLPIVAIGRPMLFGFFEFGDPVPPVPHNCSLKIGGGYAYVTANDGTKLAKYITASPEGDLVALDANIAASRQAEPHMPTLAFWTAGAQRDRPPKADDVLIQANLGATESDAFYEARLRASCRKVKRAYLCGQCYLSNLDNTQDLRRVVPLLARIARDEPNVAGIILFHAGPNRHDGWDIHPEVHSAWQQVFAGISKDIAPAPLPAPPAASQPPSTSPPAPLPLTEEPFMIYTTTDKPLPTVAYEPIAQSDGTIGLKKANGKYASLDSFGSWSERDTVQGSDERFTRGKNGSLVATNRGGKDFIVEAVEV